MGMSTFLPSRCGYEAGWLSAFWSMTPPTTARRERARDPAHYCLSQLQCGDLVGAEHGEPGVTVGSDRDPEWLAALHHLGRRHDRTRGRDARDVAAGRAGEPHRTVGFRGRDILQTAVPREECHVVRVGVEMAHGLWCEPLGKPHSPLARDVDLAG